MGDKKLEGNVIEAAASVALLNVLRDSSLLDVVRIVISVRWGSLGRLLESQRADAARSRWVEGER